MTRQLDLNKIAKGLKAERLGKVSPKGGYFGALQLLADIDARFRTPEGGGRPTDPNWTERRLVPLSVPTLKRLEEFSAALRGDGGVALEPMQLAALLLERTIAEVSDAEVGRLARPRKSVRSRSRA